MLGLVDSLSEHDQLAQYSPLMSPPVWDLAHVGNYEELWLLRSVDGRGPIDERLDDLYDAFEHPRWERPSLGILGPAEAREYIAGVRREALELLDSVDLDGSDDPLLADAFVYGLVVQHEQQHCETLLATHQLMLESAHRPPATEPAPAATSVVESREAVLPGGRFTMGTTGGPWAYDNEKPAHEVDLEPFRLDTTPVTNDAYAEFVADGGYERRDLWSDAGWQWRTDEDLDRPQFWSTTSSGEWSVLRFGDQAAINGREPVQHVCWFEADAYARWAGKRLPTEAEWEYAATWHPDEGKRRWPWGDEPVDAHLTNLGQRHFGPAEVGAYPDGANPWGCQQLVGDVWEWTASDFGGYPGFRSFPYKEYSEVFFGNEYKVLRGGSWAADPMAVRGTFRNWDYPIRRQIFCGFRCAGDA
jgi:iron(II)-dependent oxidoreductase